MSNDLEAVARSLAGIANGSNAGISMDMLMKILATDSGKRLLASLMSDGGERIKDAANAAKNGDLGGVMSLISSVAQTPDGAEVLSKIKDTAK